MHEVFWCFELAVVHSRQKAWASSASRPSAMGHIAKAWTLPEPHEGKAMSLDRKNALMVVHVFDRNGLRF